MKTSLIMALVILSILAAIFTHGLIAASFSLLAFTLLFYFVSTQQSHKADND